MKPSYFSALTDFQQTLIRRVLAGDTNERLYPSNSLRILRLRGWIWLEGGRVHLTASAIEAYDSHPYQRVWIGKRS